MILVPRNIELVRINSSDVFLRSDIIVGVGLHNQAESITRCLRSIFEQKVPDKKIAVLLFDDQSSDNWVEQAGDLLNRPEIVILNGHCGTPARTRNAILDFIDENFIKAKWIARLDADDRFSCADSLAAMYLKGEAKRARYVIGGNRLVLNGQIIPRNNHATQELLNSDFVFSILKGMAALTARNELPSCNLLLASGCGWRYPDIRSAEDHWLVADLLLNHSNDGAILESPYYCDYTLGGAETNNNTAKSHHISVRKKLYEAAMIWEFVKSLGGKLLGHGQEGVVRQIDGIVEKYFYHESLSNKDIDILTGIKIETSSHLPSPKWNDDKGLIVASYPYLPTKAAVSISVGQAHEFLTFCLANEIVCKNIKRDNFRVTSDGKLFMVDIGKDVVSMRSEYFRDSAARLYALSALGCSDGEYLRRNAHRRQEDVLMEIPGFEDFYKQLIFSHTHAQWLKAPCTDPIELSRADDISLLIKCCSMDAVFLEEQVRYIVNLLSKPRKFREVILLVDPYAGPFLRQHCPGDLELLMNRAKRLKENGIIDLLLVAPDDDDTVRGINARWFNLDCPASRAAQNAPVASQLWGFEQVCSRYVLQCDVDVLIGRHDLEHDFLAEMTEALSGENDVLSVAFNIPHPPGIQNPYDAQSGDYVPEVRCGLLDLHRIKDCLPLPNSKCEGLLLLTWHRSLQQYQKQNALRSLRGGDARSFYIHPKNHWKNDPEHLAIIRDLVAQGTLPQGQTKEWDLMGEKHDWNYSHRGEDIVFLLKGRNTPAWKLKRCISSLKMQDDLDFGLVVIDDASTETDVTLLQHYLRHFGTHYTLIRNANNKGRIPNFITGIRNVCINPETLIVILDLDDALINPKTVSKLRKKWVSGHDVILGNMFRPDKPVKLYNPQFENVREKWGADVWIHLRAFRKRLFDQLPDELLKIDGEWIQECTDYATMIPIAEQALSPVFISEYLCWHERSTIRSQEVCIRQEQLIKTILTKREYIQQMEK